MEPKLLNKILHGDCTKKLLDLPGESVDLVYFDPPFFTQRKHTLRTRDNSKAYEFEDKFDSLEDYLLLIEQTLVQCKRVLKQTGSVFLHCDKTAAHHIRVVLDKVMGEANFQSEIIWAYKRWSNAKKGLLNAHQTIFFYSKTEDFKFNTIYTDYSATTNIDQILQARARDKNGKATYKRDDSGEIVLGKAKQGVPLSDVWEIPYLNPKAKERTGYPTQKPVLLLNQIIRIASDEGDVVLDPFCGSGTTCVAAKAAGRYFIGIDVSQEAVILAENRLNEMLITESRLLQNGIADYQEKTDEELAILASLDAVPVQRNSGIDGFLREYYAGKPVPVKIQQPGEDLDDAINKLERASKGKGYERLLVVQTSVSPRTNLFAAMSNAVIIKTTAVQLSESLLKPATAYPEPYSKTA